MASYSIKALVTTLVDLALAVWAFVMILTPSLISPALGPFAFVVALVGVVYVAVFILYVTCNGRDRGLSASDIPAFQRSVILAGVLYLVAFVGVLVLATGRTNRALMAPLVYARLLIMYFTVFIGAIVAIVHRVFYSSTQAVDYY